MDLAVLVPTFNRSHFLKKYLNYHSQLKLNALFYILDSSNDEHAEKNVLTIKKLNNKNFKHVRIFGSSCQVMKLYLDKVNTKYCTFSGDDDFLSTDGVEESIKFLENNDNYAASHGKILHVVFKDNNQKNIIDVSEYKAMGFDNSYQSSIDRFKYTLKNYQTSTFAIHRTEIFKRTMSHIDEKKIELNDRTLNPDIILNNELLPNFLSCCLGKNKFIDKLYMIRTSILTESKINYFTQKSIYDYFNSEKGKETIKKFNNTLAKEITLVDKNSFEKNLKIVGEKFFYL